MTNRTKILIAFIVAIALLPVAADAQRGGRGGGGGGGRGSGSGGGNNGGKNGGAPTSQPSEDNKDKDAKKPPADLSADSVTGKWKNANTLEFVGVVKNVSTNTFKGERTA